MIPVLDLSYEIKELRKEIDEAIARVIDNTQFIMGDDVKEFERNVAEYLGTKHAIGVNSGTDALVIALKAAGIKPGDEVITTPFSFFATAESISICGAKPVFVDIREASFNINPDLIERAITTKTRAIMPVHLYGSPCEMTRILEIAQKHNLKVIEDCAQSFGAFYSGDCVGCDGTSCNSSISNSIKNKKIGTIGDAGAYSFFPSKNLGAFGDGGLITTDDDELARIAKMLRVHGAEKKYHNEILGYNSRLDSIQAAILKVKLPHIDRFNSGRRKAAKRYNNLLEKCADVITPSITNGHVFHQYTIRILNRDRDEVQQALRQAGIGCMVYYPIPQDMLPVYAGDYQPCAVSKKLAGEVLSLPIWPGIPEETQEKVVHALLEVLGK